MHQRLRRAPSIVGGVGIFDGFDVAERFSNEVATMEPDPERHERYLGEYQLFFNRPTRQPGLDRLLRVARSKSRRVGDCTEPP
jgi:hypothetical protein